jgi:hypothetical protein
MVKKESQNKSTKQEPVKRSKRIQEKMKKQNQESSDSDCEYSSDTEEEEEDNDNNMNMHEYRKFLSKIFPSKFINKKIKDLEEEIDYDEEEDSDYVDEKKKDKEKNKKQLKNVNKNGCKSSPSKCVNFCTNRLVNR